MTWVTKGIMCVILPLLTVEITFGWLLVAGLLGTLGGLLGAVYPALRAAAYDPAVALSYE
jgi:putative ABC transport system permease protein